MGKFKLKNIVTLTHKGMVLKGTVVRESDNSLYRIYYLDITHLNGLCVSKYPPSLEYLDIISSKYAYGTDFFIADE